MKFNAMKKRDLRQHGFTLVEFLVSIAVISLLLSLLVPAIQASRESARQTECRNNLRQLGVAVTNFEATYQHFPSNGWGYLWVGDPDRGVDKRQPGGWIYQTLPYIDGGTLSGIGRGLQQDDKSRILGELCAKPLKSLKCPSRPGEQVSPVNPDLVFYNAIIPTNVAKSDYAINEGDYVTNTNGGPITIFEGDRRDYPWTDVKSATGISFLRSQIRPSDVTDGMSQTYLIGEKCVSQSGYYSPNDPGYDAPMLCGVDLDISRWTDTGPLPDGPSPETRRFGSPHISGCHFVLCDGSVRQISYLIDLLVHKRLGNRKDGLPVQF